jgi:hypothetical protein
VAIYNESVTVYRAYIHTHIHTYIHTGTLAVAMYDGSVHLYQSDGAWKKLFKFNASGSEFDHSDESAVPLPSKDKFVHKDNVVRIYVCIRMYVNLCMYV